MDRGTPEEFRDLIQKAKEGDTDAFGRLYEQWYTPVYRFILLRVTSKEVAEDLTQEVFTKVFVHLDRFEMRAANPLGFLYTTARNTVIDHHKKHKSESLETLEMVEIHDETARSPELDASLGLDVQRLHGAMRTLTREQQDVILLRFIEEKPVKEAATIMNKSEEAIRQLSVRALRSLRTYFQAYET